MKNRVLINSLKNYIYILIMAIGLVCIKHILISFDGINSISDSFFTNTPYSLGSELIYPLLIKSGFLIGFVFLLYGIIRIKSSRSFLIWNSIFMLILYCLYIGMYYLDSNIYLKYLYDYSELPLLFLLLSLIYFFKYLAINPNEITD